MRPILRRVTNEFFRPLTAINAASAQYIVVADTYR
jgi:hypothetical protein